LIKQKPPALLVVFAPHLTEKTDRNGQTAVHSSSRFSSKQVKARRKIARFKQFLQRSLNRF